MTTSNAAGSTSGRPARGSGMPKRPGARSRRCPPTAKASMWCAPTIRGSATATPRARHQEMKGAVSTSLRNEAKQSTARGVGDGRHGGEAGASAAPAARRSSPAMASRRPEHEIAQGALGRGGLVARLDYAESRLRAVHRSSASISCRILGQSRKYSRAAAASAGRGRRRQGNLPDRAVHMRGGHHGHTLSRGAHARRPVRAHARQPDRSHRPPGAAHAAHGRADHRRARRRALRAAGPVPPGPARAAARGARRQRRRRSSTSPPSASAATSSCSRSRT